MKTARLVVLIGLFLSGCSYTDLANLIPTAPPPPPPTATPTATVYLTPTDTPTITPTQPTPTFTASPTLIYPNGTPVPSATWTEMPTLFVLPATLTIGGVQPQVDNGPFTSILVSGSQLFWGRCDPSSVKATVKVSAGIPADWVLIELRLKDIKSGDTTDWGGGAIMDKQGGGVFTYNLVAKNFEHYRDYIKAWGQYQFVALDVYKHRLGASGPFLSSLVIAPCP